MNTVPSLGSVGGAALASHPDVDKVAFTGSTVTGRKIMEAASKSNLKKVFNFFGEHSFTRPFNVVQISLELGGKSPQLVFESADLDQGALHSISVYPPSLRDQSRQGATYDLL